MKRMRTHNQNIALAGSDLPQSTFTKPRHSPPEKVLAPRNLANNPLDSPEAELGLKRRKVSLQSKRPLPFLPLPPLQAEVKASIVLRMIRQNQWLYPPQKLLI